MNKLQQLVLNVCQLIGWRGLQNILRLSSFHGEIQVVHPNHVSINRSPQLISALMLITAQLLPGLHFVCSPASWATYEM